MTRLRRRVVAIDPTSRGIAYAIFEGRTLIDWGHRYCGAGTDAVIAFLTRVVHDYAVDHLVLEDWRAKELRRRPRIVGLLQAIALWAGSANVAVTGQLRDASRGKP